MAPEVDHRIGAEAISDRTIAVFSQPSPSSDYILSV